MHNKAQPFTLAQWRVKPGREDPFVERWKALSEVFSNLPEPPLWGTLLRSTTDASLFYSFGPWRDPADIAAMRENPAAQAGLARLAEVCVDFSPGAFEVVEHVDVPAG